MLGEHTGIFRKQVEVMGAVGAPLVTVDQIRVILGED